MFNRESYTSTKINIVRPVDPITAIVKATDSCMNGKSASFVRHIDIDLSGTPLAGTFTAGQSIAVIPPGLRENGKPEKARLYSISSATNGADGEGQVVSICVKRVIDEYVQQHSNDPVRGTLFLGKCSNYLCDLHVGDEVKVAGPSGKRFVLPSDQSAYRYVFLATGTGIAPYRGFIGDLLHSGALEKGTEVHLLMGVPYTTDLLYHPELITLVDQYPNFHYYWALSREAAGTLTRRAYLPELIKSIEGIQTMLKADNTLMYICGLSGMQTGVYEALLDLSLEEPYLKSVSRGERRYIRANPRCLVEVY
jgi:ferredoxin--NADP+ reductase